MSNNEALPGNILETDIFIAETVCKPFAEKTILRALSGSFFIKYLKRKTFFDPGIEKTALNMV
jgi:hypothetical protein